MNTAWKHFWIVIGLIAAAGVAAAIWTMPEIGRSNVAAAWVQAVGSVAAIIASVMIGNRAAKKARHAALEVQNREAAGRLEVALHVANQARELLQVLRSRFRGGDTSLGANDFDSVREALQALPFADLRSGPLVKELMTIRRVLGSIQAISARYEDFHGVLGAELLSQLKSEFERKATALERSYDAAEAAYEAALLRLDALHDAGGH